MRSLRKTRKFQLIILLSLIVFTFIVLHGEKDNSYDYSRISSKFHCDTKSSYGNKFLTFNFITIKGKAGLGNQLFEVFSLIGMSKLLGRIPFFNSKDIKLVDNLGFLSRTVPQIIEEVGNIPIEIENSTRVIQSSSCCSFEIHPLLKCEQSKFLVIEGGFFQSYKYFANVDVRRFFQPTPEQSTEIQNRVNLVDKNRFKTCVHVRRGDFLEDNVHEESDLNFIINSIRYLKEKVASRKNRLFYIFGNDPDWAEKHLQKSNDSIRIMRTPSNRAIEDLHFSMLFCDSVLITAPSSTFGFWIGYISKNQNKVYYRDIFETNDQVKYEMSTDDFYPKSWTRLSMSKTGQITE